MFMDEGQWAEETFGRARLGDPRRTRRLVAVAARLAQAPSLSLDATCRGDAAAAQGAHRLMRNDAITPDAIADAGYAATLDRARTGSGRLLAVEDTTALSYSHSVARELGDMGGVEGAETQGWWQHTALLVDAEDAMPLGLIEQGRWVRPPEQRGKKRARKKREYADKESYKWEQASRRIASRLGPELLARTTSVCDRESDIYEYLLYKAQRAEHFVVRAAQDRNLTETPEHHLWARLERAGMLGTRVVHVAQRAGRPARIATLVVRAEQVRLRGPRRVGQGKLPDITVWAVLASEEGAPAGVEPLCWLLLTDRPAADLAQAESVVSDYEKRWIIEDFHRAWKSGCGVEARRQQTVANLERMVVLTSFVAVRLLQLRTLARHCDEASCETVLTRTQWLCLWLSTQKTPPPSQPPTAAWAYLTLAKLGGFRDTKRTGRPGWEPLWRGWERLAEQLKGFELAMRYQSGDL